MKRNMSVGFFIIQHGPGIAMRQTMLWVFASEPVGCGCLATGDRSYLPEHHLRSTSVPVEDVPKWVFSGKIIEISVYGACHSMELGGKKKEEKEQK